MDTITNETNGQKIPYSTHTFSQDKVNALFVNNSQQLKQLLPNELTNEKLEGGITTMNVRNFNINTERILSLETDFYHALTYLVTKDDVAGVINLTFYSWDYKNYFPVVTYYDVDETDVANYYEGIPFNTSKVKYINTDFDYVSTLSNITTSSKTEYDPCVKVYIEIVNVACKGDGHMPGDSSCVMTGSDRAYTKQVFVIDTTACDEDDTGGGGGPGSGSGPGTNPNIPILEQPGSGNPGYPDYQTPGMGFPGGGGGIANPGDIRFPIKGIPVLINFPSPNQKNCEQLKNWSNQQQPTLNVLYNNRNDIREHGRAFKLNINQTTGARSIVADNTPIPLTTGNEFQLNITSNIGGAYVGISHTHTNPNTTLSDGSKALPIFSATDILALIRLAYYFQDVQNKDYNDFFFTLTTNAGTYALKLPSMNNAEFYTKFHVFLTDKKKQKELKDEIKHQYDDLIRDTSNPSSNQYEEALLMALEEVDLKIEVYKTENNNGNFGGDWNQLKLNKKAVGNKVVENPCSTLKVKL